MAEKIETLIEKLATPIAEENGLIIYDVEFVKEGPDHCLRVFIDRLDGGITLDDCEAVSRPLSDLLDEVDPISVSYYLEVSSPGIERKLKKQQDFDRFLGSEVLLKLFSAINGTKKLQGILISRDSEKTVIEVNSENIEVPNDKISKANIVYQG